MDARCLDALAFLAVITNYSAALGAALRQKINAPTNGGGRKISLATRTAPTIQTRRRTIPPTIINTIRQESPSRLDSETKKSACPRATRSTTRAVHPLPHAKAAENDLSKADKGATRKPPEKGIEPPKKGLSKGPSHEGGTEWRGSMKQECGTRFLSKGARGRQKRKQDGVLVATKGGTGQRVLRAPTSDGRDGNRDPRQRRSSASTTTIPNMGVSGWVHSDMTLPPPKTSNLNSMPESPHRMALRDDH
eukprot:121353_1